MLSSIVHIACTCTCEAYSVLCTHVSTCTCTYSKFLICMYSHANRIHDMYISIRLFFCLSLSLSLSLLLSLSLSFSISFAFYLFLDYLLSNNHVNSIIVLKLDFSDEEVLAYYISFLKTLSFKLNNHTIHFFYNEVRIQCIYNCNCERQSD